MNQNLNIALFQNLFLRFHNYIANELQLQHPSWTDEIVYQETRRIVAAVVQIITYDHFLPIVLGKSSVSPSSFFVILLFKESFLQCFSIEKCLAVSINTPFKKVIILFILKLFYRIIKKYKLNI